ncbi:MAG: 1-acyl-sn-glycerol-3-phosphate acyltransferase [Muribaculaceae bacterium]|nr:1-acyl-sn-glycerol-3-phosphate acyltransferase [Muribaculaceae bacterium]
MNPASTILRLFGWTVNITVPDAPKCIICVAPHTSNWDFVLGKLAYAAAGRKAGFLMKSQWFFWPLGCFFRSIGGIPVERKGTHRSLVEIVVEKFRTTPGRLQIAITPEGTRQANADWHTGFLRIAREADVPVQLGVIDFGKREIRINDVFIPTGDIEADMRAVKDFYRRQDCRGLYPDQFIL